MNAACTAWNIALLSEGERKKALDSFIKQYEAINPGIDDTDGVRHDMELLIKEKIRLYPDIKRIIANARIIDDNGKQRIVVASTDYHQKWNANHRMKADGAMSGGFGHCIPNTHFVPYHTYLPHPRPAAYAVRRLAAIEY